MVGDLSFFIVVITVFGAILVSYFLFKKLIQRDNWKTPDKPFPLQWKSILAKKVNFYANLSNDDKAHFEFKVQEFLMNHRITGIECDVTIEDNLLVAASAIVPVFKFPKWRYSTLYEVFLYPDSFNDHHEVKGDGRTILGMVGSGYMEGRMILSKKALHHGFDNESDKKNTAIHEFVHLIDKEDGNIDGIPEVLMEKQYTIPWIDMIEQKIETIYKNDSDINPYGGTSRIEFFAVISEYFFERPKLLSKKHPELYKFLEEIYDHDMKGHNLNRADLKINRNDPCPCGSGKKFKKCCGKNHY